jgi:hypothetical protein
MNKPLDRQGLDALIPLEVDVVAGPGQGHEIPLTPVF